MDEYLCVQAESRSRMCAVQIAGELDYAVAALFTRRAQAAVAAVPGPVVIDLSGLTYIDAAGARALSLFLRDLPDGRLAAISPYPRAVSRVLRLTGLPSPQSWVPRPRTAPDTLPPRPAGQPDRLIRPW